MSHRTSLFAVLVLAASSLHLSAATDAERLFALKIKPLLSEKCDSCHGKDPDKVKGEFRTLTREDLLKGGESQHEVLVPGDSKKSFILTSVRWEDADYEMPPKENDRLTAEQIKLLEEWISAGAPWPSEEEQLAIQVAESKKTVTEDGVIVPTAGGLADSWTNRRYQSEDIWGFMPVKKPAVPARVNPVDFFVNEKLSAAQIQPADRADARTLARRIYFDLTGLPPSPEEVTAFQTASAKNHTKAVETLVDKLLATPQYGERWAQHWFDVTRYSDTGGMANDYERSNMWRYRDYVIRAFNEDMPYNEFIMEQLAGDEMADAAALNRLHGDQAKLAKVRAEGGYTDEEARMFMATGFLRMGPWDNAMITDAEARQIYLDDVVNVVGQTFLATTMRCFKCHDHKFDPLPTKDYYRMYAAFAGTQMAERPLKFTQEENDEGFEEGRKLVQRMHAFADEERQTLVNKRETAAKAWFKEHGLEYKDNDQRKNLPDEVKPPRNVGLDYVDEGQLKVREQDEWIWARNLERYEPMVQSVYDGPDSKMSFKSARKLRMPAEIKEAPAPQSFIYTGGSLEAPGSEVTPGVLSVLQLSVEGDSEDAFALPQALPQRRLALAKWIAHPQNALTSRSIVNRLWQYHFGKPIVSTPNNFGVKGGKPTHPALLEWLAADFVDNGWTMKRLHKLIMTSEAYQMAASHPQSEKLRNEDPNNDLLAFFPNRRLSAEELRDAMLSVTGELNLALGGLPIMPEINMEVALQPRMIQFSLAPAYQPSPTPAQRNRRSIYAYKVRGQADPFLEVFNLPNPNESCDLRDSAAVSPQAFTMMNSDLITDRSIAFALRIQKEAKDFDQQIIRAFELALNRAPNPAERNRMTTYVREMQDYHRGAKPGPVKYPTQVTRSLVEEFSGKIFEYEEILPVFENYVPDKKPSDVGAETRALADLCLALFNSHEFTYLY